MDGRQVVIYAEFIPDAYALDVSRLLFCSFPAAVYATPVVQVLSGRAFPRVETSCCVHVEGAVAVATDVSCTPLLLMRYTPTPHAAHCEGRNPNGGGERGESAVRR